MVRRQAVLSAAGEVFLRKGFRAATMEEIAVAAGIAVGTLYHYFDSKEEIYVSILTESIRMLRERLTAAAAKQVPPALSLVSLGRAYADCFVEHPEYFKIQMAFQQESSVAEGFVREREKLYGLIRENLEIFAEKIRDGQRAGTFRRDLEPMLMATALWSSYSGILSATTNQRLLDVAGISFSRLLAASAALHFSGLTSAAVVSPISEEGAAPVSLEDLREVMRSVPWIDPGTIFRGMRMAFQPQKARGIDQTYRFDVRGERGGVWSVTIRDGTIEVTEGETPEGASVTIETTDHRFVELTTGQVQGIELIVNGEMKITGDLQRAALFQSFFLPENGRMTGT
ncbi:MAG: TetR family transcriptional regulator [Candidatus Binatia bacterium]